LTEGEEVIWSYVLHNTGNETLINIVVTDNKAGIIECPESSLLSGEFMTCTSSFGLATEPIYENNTTVTAIGAVSNTEVSDSDLSHYQTSYHIGTHFWIDGSNGGENDGIYQEGIETPIDDALVELLNGEGEKLYWTDDIHSALTTIANGRSAETKTANGGEYGFDVPAGTYQVRFNIPQELLEEGYNFVEQGTNSNDDINKNVADDQGLTQRVDVGPGYKTEDLTLDAAVNCACSDIASDGADALSKFSFGIMFIMTFFIGFLFVRREEV